MGDDPDCYVGASHIALSRCTLSLKPVSDTWVRSSAAKLKRDVKHFFVPVL